VSKKCLDVWTGLRAAVKRGKVDSTTGSAGGAACVRRSAHFAPWVCHGCAWPAQQSRMWCI